MWFPGIFVTVPFRFVQPRGGRSTSHDAEEDLTFKFVAQLGDIRYRCHCLIIGRQTKSVPGWRGSLVRNLHVRKPILKHLVPRRVRPSPFNGRG